MRINLRKIFAKIDRINLLIRGIALIILLGLIYMVYWLFRCPEKFLNEP